MSSKEHMLPEWKPGESEPMTFESFLANVISYIARHPEQRAGQGLLNVLHMVRPDLFERIVGTEVDPFHASDWNLVVRAIAWIGLHWFDEVPDA